MGATIACLTPSDTFEYTRIFEEIFRDRVDEDVTLEGFKPHHGEMPDDYTYDGVVITGSGFHVYEEVGAQGDEDMWQDRMDSYVQDALEQDIPVFGGCYGHQSLANLLGGTVESLADSDRYPADDECIADREMGYRTIHVTADGRESDMFDGIGEEFVSFQSHQDYVADLPDDAELLAENEYGVQAFQSTEYPAYGVQFHPEYDLKMAQDLLDSKDLDQETYDTIAETLTEENEQAASKSRIVFDNYLKHVL